MVLPLTAGMAKVASVWVTALVLCAETSGLETEARAVGQVVLNRVLDGGYPDTIAGVVLQRRQFARPGQCGRGWLRAHHWRTASRMHARPGHRIPSWRFVQRDVLGFMTLKAWRRLRRRWKRRGWEVAGVSKMPDRRRVHVFLRKRR